MNSRPNRLCVLGAGTAWPTAERGNAGLLLQWPDGRSLLIDPGSGSLRAAARAGVEVPSVLGVLFSHYHPDHCLDWIALRFALHHPALLGQRIVAAGPVGLRDLDARIDHLFGRWVELEARQDLFELEPGPFRLPLATDLVLEAEALRVPHTEHSVGYRFRTRAGVVAYTGDCGEDERVVELCRDADLALIEAAFPDGSSTAQHLTPSRAACIAARANCRRLVILHLYPETAATDVEAAVRRQYHGPLWIARDADTFDV